MRAKVLQQDVYWVGAVDRESRVFDNLIPIPNGTSYNSYLVKGAEKTVLIDTVDPPYCDHLFARLADAGVESLDAIVINHVEQDHSGSLPKVLERFPKAQVVCSAKAKGMLADHLNLSDERIQTVADGDTLDIGGGESLNFLMTPWVHWPETMMTWLPKRRILFPCDFFGSHLASDTLFVKNDALFLDEAKRYYAQIMMPFSGASKKYTSRISELNPAMIAPSHGPVIDRPEIILDAYKRWTGDAMQNKALLVYVSMHGSTKCGVEMLIDALDAQGVEVNAFALPDTDLGRIAMELVDSATLILATPSVLGGPHPHIASAAFVANMLKPKTRFLAVMGSYGWGNKLMRELEPLISAFKAEILEPVFFKGLPTAETETALTELANQIAEKHRSLDLM